ncbi:MAG TPA: efflux RND transporter permease subunit [Bryobacteraceae bacterium]|nr:efflux RND transporter permease subunit [Bryobacteraceae bacterium]
MEPAGDDHKNLALRLSEFSIRHPVTTWMIFASFIVLGTVSATKIPLVMAPDIKFPFVGVHVPYPNATPEQIQETITKPVEEAVSTIPHIQLLRSRSSADEAWIDLNFEWGADMEWLRAEVREKVEQIRHELPADVERIRVMNFGTEDIPILEGRIATKRDLRHAYDFLEAKVKRPIERVPGVGEVEMWGAVRNEIDIYLRLDDVKRHRVEVGALFRRLDSVNLDRSLGRVVDRDARYSAMTRGTLKSLDDIRNFPVNSQGLRLSQVADIIYDNPPINYGRHLNGEYAIGFGVRKTSEANTVETVRRVLARIEEINRDPSLGGVQILVWHDSGKEITKSLSGLLEAGTIGALLAVVVLFLFLRKVGATLAIGFAIPFSMIATVGFLYLLGKTLNVLSMMGLMLAAGMLVDNAVVVLESIYQNLEKGRDRVSAAVTGAREVITAVFAATLTSIIIFVPLVFGKATNYSMFLADTGTSIMIALLCSLFISLTLIPLGMARTLNVDISKRSRFDEWLYRHVAPLGRRLVRRRASPAPDDAKGGSVVELYLRMMAFPLKHKFLVGFVLIPAVFAVSLIVLKKVPDNSPEAQDLQDLAIQYNFTENYHYAKIERDFVAPVERYLLRNREKFKIKDVSSNFGNNNAFSQVYFDKDRVTLEELKDIRQEIAKGLPVIPGAEIRLGRQEGAERLSWIGVNLYGDDSTVLQSLVREAKSRLLRHKGFIEVHNDLDRGKEEVQLRMRRDLARKYNVSPQSVANVLGIILRGQQIRGYSTPEGEVDIYMRLRPGDREDLDDLKSMVVGSGSNGRDVLLEQVADLQIVKTPGVIQREDRRNYSWMWANFSGGQKDEGKEQMTQVMNSIDYPQGYGWSFGFWTKRQDQEDNDFLFNILLALFMVYFVMAALFESLAHPFAIMLSLPFAMVGVVWTLYLTGTPFNLMAKIGLMVLVGIVVNNGIVLLDHVNNLRRAGMNRSDAILRGCRERFRPILMTATTTIVGLFPLAVGTSGMFELRYFPLARTVMGGLAASTVLSLIVLPTYYELFDDLAQYLKRMWYSTEPEASETRAYGD